MRGVSETEHASVYCIQCEFNLIWRNTTLTSRVDKYTIHQCLALETVNAYAYVFARVTSQIPLYTNELGKINALFTMRRMFLNHETCRMLTDKKGLLYVKRSRQVWFFTPLPLQIIWHYAQTFKNIYLKCMTFLLYLKPGRATWHVEPDDDWALLRINFYFIVTFLNHS